MKDCTRSVGGSYRREELRLSMKRRSAKDSGGKQTAFSPQRQTSSSALRSTPELRSMHDVTFGRRRPTHRGQAVAAKKRDKKSMVSASQLSQMGACERFVLFEARYGKRKSRCQQEAIERGRTEHVKFFK